MWVAIDLLGKKFGKLVVLEQVKERGKHRKVYWICKCDCGNTATVLGDRLKNGHTKSCGCYARERSRDGNSTHGQNRRGGKRTAEYNAWSSMKERCLNPNYKEFQYYGGRGITVCERWLVFENFFADMGVRTSTKHSLDRFPNVNGNYEPTNCRWATTAQQSRVKRNNVWIEYNGLKMVQADWAIHLGTTAQTLWGALKKKSFEDIYKFYMETEDRKASTNKLISSKLQVVPRQSVDRIRLLYSEGIRQSDLARTYSVSKQTVNRIVHYKGYLY